MKKMRRLDIKMVKQMRKDKERKDLILLSRIVFVILFWGFIHFINLRQYVQQIDY